jgi:hypothetical protein
MQFLHPPVTLFLLDPNIILSILFWKHPYKKQVQL